MKKEKCVLALYLILVFVISAPLEAIWIIHGEAADNIVALVMFVPAIIAVILKLVFFRKQKLLGLNIGKPIYYLYAVMIPVAYIGLSYLLYWLFVPGTFVGTGVMVEAILNVINIQNIPVAIVVAFLVQILANILVTFGEEAGWRGLMYPIMDNLWGRNKALIISGGVWALWHLPGMIWGSYNAGAHILYQVPMFTIHILSGTVIASWLRMKSNSVWPAALWHAMHNFLDQSVFRSMTSVENSAYFISETGFITTLFAVSFAVLILVFGKFERAKSDEQSQTI
jgi:membrane protease YdiL (CAAX protease family)